jgi:hypothetical protein
MQPANEGRGVQELVRTAWREGLIEARNGEEEPLRVRVDFYGQVLL